MAADRHCATCLSRVVTGGIVAAAQTTVFFRVPHFSGATVFDEDCLRHVMGVPGALGAALVDHGSGLVVRFAGRVPSEDQRTTGAGVAGLVDATLGSAAFANVGS